jgi:peptidyl-prolyl cis-trans isomerase A (cyclophilin A)
MKARSLVPALVVLLSLAACKENADAAAPKTVGGPVAVKAPADPKPNRPTPWTDKVAEGKDVYASIETNLGTVVVKLYSKDAPKTVKNFVGLATGEKDWKNPATGETVQGKPLYVGTIFHRVIDGFMIQGGDPMGTGRGDPGYRFEDEFQSGKTFDKVGLLAMANAGPGTNGSQFFITVSTPTYLNNRHTIFGEVVKGYEAVTAIAKTPKGPGDRPLQAVTITKIELFDSQP